MPKVIGQQFSVHVDPAPGPDEVCDECGADAEHYVKHPELIGGSCGVCGAMWFPGLSFGKPRPLYAHQLDVIAEKDGSAVVHLAV